MHNSYADIRDRIAEAPRWWDEFGVPRYVEFAPSEVADIYATEAALLLIRCQNCRTPFRVANSWAWNLQETPRLSDTSVDGLPNVGWGDPPNAGCCPAGPTMSSDPVKVLQFWKREQLEWMRCPELEVRLDDEDEE